MTAAPQIAWLREDDPPNRFPPANNALVEPDGLLAAGGDLSSERLVYAYRHGIFPWYDENQPILWWSPNPRCVIDPQHFHMSKRLLRYARQSDLSVTFNQNFSDVTNACRQPRPQQDGTWITDDMKSAYSRLHAEGWAHSVEIWRDNSLVGGLYGLAIGKVFFGESMFSETDHASKFALKALCKLMLESDMRLLDCQVVSPHLLSLGAETVERHDFLANLEILTNPQKPFENWPNGTISVRELC